MNKVHNFYKNEENKTMVVTADGEKFYPFSFGYIEDFRVALAAIKAGEDLIPCYREEFGELTPCDHTGKTIELVVVKESADE